MARNNEERIGAKDSHDNPALAMGANPLSFTTPTDFVELPSRGEFYAESHPLHKKESVEIKFMTAKEEEILTSPALLKNGTAIDKLIDSVMVDKRIKSENLLIGDKNAILIQSRITGYGTQYVTKVQCPSCLETSEHEFDLDECKNVKESVLSDDLKVEKTENGNFKIALPLTGVEVEFRLLTGKDENRIMKIAEKARKTKTPASQLVNQLATMIVSLNGYKTNDVITQFARQMPAQDSRFLRKAYDSINPTVDLTHSFECSNCQYEGMMEVPFTTDFFWSKL